MRLHRYLSITPLIALAAAQGKCRFLNGTLLPDDPAWNIYQPCLAENGPVTTCCALARSNPPYGNISLGPTQDECLPNGVCMNRMTSKEGERITTWFIDYCTENGQKDEATKCANVCSTGDQELTAKITPCDGTKNSTKWCCGASTDCCSGNYDIKPVELAQILGAVSSSVISSSASAISSFTSAASQTSVSASTTPNVVNANNSVSSSLSGGAIAGIVIGALAGLALIAAALLFLCSASRKKKAGYEAPPAADYSSLVEAPASSPSPGRQEMSSGVKYAHVAEMPGPPPIELQGDAPVHAPKP